MTPSPGLLLGNVAGCLFDAVNTTPGLHPDIGAAAALVAAIAADVDRCVSDRLERAGQIEALLAQARGILPAHEAAEIDAARTCRPALPADFTFQNVDGHLRKLKVALIAAQVWLENAPGAQAAELVDAIMCFAQEDVDHSSRHVPGLL